MSSIRVASTLSFLTIAAFAFGAAGLLMPTASADCNLNIASTCATACNINAAGTCGGDCNINVLGTCSGTCNVNVLGTCTSSCPTQPVHTYGLAGSIGANSNTLSEQTSGSPVGSVGGASAGVTDVQDTNAADCNGDGVPGDFDGDYDFGVGGAYFGSSTTWDVADGCNYGLNVHATSGVATDVTGLPVSGTYGVDDVAGPTVVTDPTTGATVSCQTDGGITPDTDANDCLSDWTGSWTQGTCGTTGGDDGYWLFLNTQVSETGGSVSANVATTGTLAAQS